MTAPDRPTAPETGVEALARAMLAAALFPRAVTVTDLFNGGMPQDLILALAADGWALTRADAGLDVKRLAKAVYHVWPGLAQGYVERIAAEYDRLASEPSEPSDAR